MSFKISYNSDQSSGMIQGAGGVREAKKEVKFLKNSLSGLSFIVTINKKDVTNKF